MRTRGIKEWSGSGQKIMILGTHREEKMDRWRLDQYEDTIRGRYGVPTEGEKLHSSSCFPRISFFQVSLEKGYGQAHGQGQGQALTGFAYPNDATLVPMGE